jgi:beta-phosphoglucomutase-like phosphatase (HAD superfamily)
VHKSFERKAELSRDYAAACEPRLFLSVTEFAQEARQRPRRASASGGRLEQIVWAFNDTPIEKDFAAIMSAEDTMVGKPDQEI